jgi:hypothetical protein
MAVASREGFVREIGIFNTTVTACAFRIARITAAGTPGTALTEVQYETTDAAPDMTAFNAWSADATITAADFRRVQLGAAVGSGAIFTFGSRGIHIPAGTANGIGIVPIGTGQVVEFYIDWME